MKQKLFILLVMLCVTNISWSLASPIGSSSDDNFHLASIWCSQGIREGVCEQGAQQFGRKLPVPIANAGICYLGDNEKSAKCTNDELRSFPNSMIETDHLAKGSIVNGKQSLYYWLNGLLVSSNTEASVLLMRIINGLIMILLLVLAWSSAARERNHVLWAVLLFTAIPVFVFIVNSNNSSSWTFLGAGFGWYFVDAAITSELHKHRKFAVAGLIACFALCAASRSDALAFFAIHTLFVMGLRAKTFGILSQNAFAAAVAIIGAIVAGFGLMMSGALTFLSSGFSYVFDDTPLQRNGRWILVHNIQSISDLYVGLVGGIRGIGASDTELYGFVRLAMISSIGFIVITALRGSSSRAKYLFVGLISICLILPLWILQVSKLIVGEELLPRYLYPLFVFVVAFSLIQRETPLDVSKGQMMTLSVLVAIAHSISLRQVLLRHTNGIEEYGLINLDHHREWWWTIPVFATPLTVWIGGSFAFAYLAIYIGKALTTYQIVGNQAKIIG
jgi:hypothetical protein